MDKSALQQQAQALINGYFSQLQLKLTVILHSAIIQLNLIILLQFQITLKKMKQL